MKLGAAWLSRPTPPHAREALPTPVLVGIEAFSTPGRTHPFTWMLYPQVELNTVVNCKQYVLKMMVFRQIPNLILINWMQDFDQHEKNRKLNIQTGISDWEVWLHYITAIKVIYWLKNCATFYWGIVEAGSIPDLWRSSAGGEQVGENIPSVVLLLVAQFEQGPVVVQLVGNFCADTRMMLQLELIPEKTAPPATAVCSRQEKRWKMWG
ncbi:uncharacterized protein LOC134425908 [Melospiza melodia melodia]|uniref:uncharacterized protein LOC134425908 n=1 Tax=Melospiza melodia melodia TaxID=1914991 RepID=UPI002FCF0CD0